MRSRAEILAKLKANKPEPLPLPQIDPAIFDENLNLIEEFTKKVEVVGGNVYRAISANDVVKQINAMLPDTKVNYSALEGTYAFNTVDLNTIKDPRDLEDLDILILNSDLAVAENGAVWVNDQNLPIRVLPFITKHLVLVLSKTDVLPYMHQAYEKLNQQPTDFGVFISGPSKTADIEQSLVIGAHGALSLSVFLLD
ncbi:LutC/YkgG family protein [Tamlana crocina]|uniref:LUD domain-containing protein n=1 Tax=Tamlana crocina TaxID=393006 RepID=A0ABX1DAU7_9FLAO|nr:LUD domain-containing protein [Tamlana crocina]NJX15474.1 LUD domain-containing protein [Tamlana crocina]